MKLSRRRFMLGLGGAAAAFPLLRVLGAGAATDFPRRIIFFITPNGLGNGGRGDRPDHFWPETGLTSSPILERLAAFEPKLTVLRGLDMRSALMGTIPPDHNPDFRNALTGRQAMPRGSGWTGASESVDQHIANVVGDVTAYRSLHFGVQSGGHAPLYRGPGESVSAENDPFAMKDRLFGDFMRDTAELERLRLERQSVLDAIGDDLQATRCRLGAEQAEAFDRHLESLRSYERTLEMPGGFLGASCDVPTIGDRIDHRSSANFDAIARAQMDLLAMSLTCDMTRVATVQLSRAASNLPIDVDGRQWEWHRTIHDGGLARDVRYAARRAANRRMADHYAYLLGKLDDVREGEGTLLDHTAVVWVAEQSLGCCHRRTDMGYVIAGSCCGALRTGHKQRFYSGETDSRGDPLGLPHNRLLITLAQAMGLPTTTFGEPSLSEGGALDELLA